MYTPEDHSIPKDESGPGVETLSFNRIMEFDADTRGAPKTGMLKDDWINIDRSAIDVERKMPNAWTGRAKFPLKAEHHTKTKASSQAKRGKKGARKSSRDSVRQAMMDEVDAKATIDACKSSPIREQ